MCITYKDEIIWICSLVPALWIHDIGAIEIKILENNQTSIIFFNNRWDNIMVIGYI